MQNGDSAPQLIQGYAGEYQFCSNCLSQDICNKKGMPKILRCCYDAIEYSIANQNYQDHIWAGSYRDQPHWLVIMSAIVSNERNKILEENREREDAKRFQTKGSGRRSR